MRLFHFTSLGHLPLIQEWGGLEKGDVMVGENGERSLNATWFSTDPNPARSAMGDGTQFVLVPKELRPDGMPALRPTVDKRAARITVVIPTTDRNLRRWLPYAQGRLGQRLIDFHVGRAGGRRHVEDWYIYTGLVPASRFQAVELRGEDGVYRAATRVQLDAIKPHVTGWSYAVEPADPEH